MHNLQRVKWSNYYAGHGIYTNYGDARQDFTLKNGFCISFLSYGNVVM